MWNIFKSINSSNKNTKERTFLFSNQAQFNLFFYVPCSFIVSLCLLFIQFCFTKTWCLSLILYFFTIIHTIIYAFSSFWWEKIRTYTYNWNLSATMEMKSTCKYWFVSDLERSSCMQNAMHIFGFIIHAFKARRVHLGEFLVLCRMFIKTKENRQHTRPVQTLSILGSRLLFLSSFACIFVYQI